MHLSPQKCGFHLTGSMVHWLVSSFDQTMQEFSTLPNSSLDWKIFLLEMQAQLFFHYATVILNRAQKVGLIVVNLLDSVIMQVIT